jgi:hypothetical protein
MRYNGIFCVAPSLMRGATSVPVAASVTVWSSGTFAFISAFNACEAVGSNALPAKAPASIATLGHRCRSARNRFARAANDAYDHSNGQVQHTHPGCPAVEQPPSLRRFFVPVQLWLLRGKSCPSFLTLYDRSALLVSIIVKGAVVEAVVERSVGDAVIKS